MCLRTTRAAVYDAALVESVLLLSFSYPTFTPNVFSVFMFRNV